MLQHILSLTAILSFLCLGLVADEAPSLQNPQEIEEQTEDENLLACGCKKKKTNQTKTGRELASSSSTKENKSA